MKKPKTLLLAIIAMMALFSSQAFASVSYDDNSTILIHQLPTDPIGAPRSPAFNPFTAYLNVNAWCPAVRARSSLRKQARLSIPLCAMSTAHIRFMSKVIVELPCIV